MPPFEPIPLPELARTARERRNRLAARFGEGIAVLSTAPERTRNRDTHYPYRFDSYFYYLTAFPEPEAVVVIVGGAKPRHILFCRARDPERELWDGTRAGPEGACARFGADDAFPIGDIDDILPGLIEGRRRLYYALGRQPEFGGRGLCARGIG